MTKLKILKNDKVQVIAGKDKGKIGEVLKVFPGDNKVLVSGVNVIQKHTKPTQTTEGGIKKKESPIHVSNVSYIDPKSSKITKLGYKTLEDGSKVRFSRKSGEVIVKK
ncbi:MAG TPA: 50S ribosomal protein L24 [Candidatus Megaira endosymbiont of Nemacystus decipiens]|nr:50S ribosomal protein L24 [Candidatus Megaera endosymbiont of Nemacystus decipiens]